MLDRRFDSSFRLETDEELIKGARTGALSAGLFDGGQLRTDELAFVDVTFKILYARMRRIVAGGSQCGDWIVHRRVLST